MHKPVSVALAALLLERIKKELPAQVTPDAIRCNQKSYNDLLIYHGFKPDDAVVGFTGSSFSGMSIFLNDSVLDGVYEAGFSVNGQFKTPIEAWAGKFGTLPLRAVKLEGA